MKHFPNVRAAELTWRSKHARETLTTGQNGATWSGLEMSNERRVAVNVVKLSSTSENTSASKVSFRPVRILGGLQTRGNGENLSTTSNGVSKPFSSKSLLYRLLLLGEKERKQWLSVAVAVHIAGLHCLSTNSLRKKSLAVSWWIFRQEREVQALDKAVNRQATPEQVTVVQSSKFTPQVLQP